MVCKRCGHFYNEKHYSVCPKCEMKIEESYIYIGKKVKITKAVKPLISSERWRKHEKERKRTQNNKDF